MDQILSHLSLSWAIFAALMIVIEVAVPHFGCLFPGIAAGVAMAFSFQFSTTVQLGVFSVVLVAGVVLLRPWLLKQTRSSAGVPARTFALLGRHAVVTTAANPGEMGRVSIDGQDWAMRSDKKLSVGDEVKVKTVDGIVLIVN
jgi:membrane protein implicated in regulation of membrane protease activity